MDIASNIHSYARQIDEKVYHSGEFGDEPQKTVVAGCMFIAYEFINQGGMFRERKIYYSERSFLTPAAHENVLRHFADLERFSRFKATKEFSQDSSENMGQGLATESEDLKALLRNEDARLYGRRII